MIEKYSLILHLTSTCIEIIHMFCWCLDPHIHAYCCNEVHFISGQHEECLYPLLSTLSRLPTAPGRLLYWCSLQYPRRLACTLQPGTPRFKPPCFSLLLDGNVYLTVLSSIVRKWNFLYVKQVLVGYWRHFNTRLQLKEHK